MSARQRWWPSGQAAVPVAEQGRQSSARSSTAARARYGKKPNCPTVGPNSATTGVPTPVAMCMTPVSPDTTTRARASSAPVSWSENSPAALATAPPPSATSCCASPRSSGPPTMTGRYPAAPSRSARALQCATGQRLVAWAAPGASAARQPSGEVTDRLAGLERHDLGEVRVVGHERRHGALCHVHELRLGVTGRERAHERRGQQDVADRAEADQEDAQHVAK